MKPCWLGLWVRWCWESRHRRRRQTRACARPTQVATAASGGTQVPTAHQQQGEAALRRGAGGAGGGAGPAPSAQRLARSIPQLPRTCALVFCNCRAKPRPQPSETDARADAMVVRAAWGLWGGLPSMGGMCNAPHRRGQRPAGNFLHTVWAWTRGARSVVHHALRVHKPPPLKDEPEEDRAGVHTTNSARASFALGSPRCGRLAAPDSVRAMACRVRVAAGVPTDHYHKGV